MKRFMYLSIAVATVLVCGCNKADESNSTQSRTTPQKQETKIHISRGGEVTVPGFAYLDGRDQEASPPLTMMRINIWDNAPRKQIVCSLTHGDRVELMDSRYLSSESRYYLKIKSGSCTGWIPDTFISAEKHAPIGDKIGR